MADRSVVVVTESVERRASLIGRLTREGVDDGEANQDRRVGGESEHRCRSLVVTEDLDQGSAELRRGFVEGLFEYWVELRAE